MTIRLLPATLALVLVSSSVPARPHAQDTQAMLKWASVDVIKYRIVGVYSARTDVVAGSDVGYADVTDRVVIDLRWKQSEAKLSGTPTIANEPSATKNLANPEPKCSPPTLDGAYEHFTLTSIKEGLGGALEMQVQQIYPDAKVIQSCTGTPKSVKGKTETRPEQLMIVSPMLFAMPETGSKDVTISPDKKSIIVNKNGWTWTYTPTV